MNVEIWITRGCGLIAFLSILTVVLFVLQHSPAPALPVDLLEKEAFKNAEFRVAAAEAIKQISAIMATLAAGLVAVMGALLNSLAWSRSLDKFAAWIILGPFLFCEIAVLVHCYDVYTIAAVQLDSGYFFIKRIEESTSSEARYLTAAGGLTFAMTCIWLFRR